MGHSFYRALYNNYHNLLKFRFVTGVILRDKIPSFEKFLWRACCGNVLVKLIEIETPMDDPSTVRIISAHYKSLMFSYHNFLILLWNTNSLYNQKNELITTLHKKKFDVAWISETHLTNGPKSPYITLMKKR